MERKSKLTIAIAIAVLGATVIYAEDHAQDKYSLKTPSGMAFSDFRGYEDWSVVSSARTDEVLKVIVANPTMINAYKAGVPGNGQPLAVRSPFSVRRGETAKSLALPNSRSRSPSPFPCATRAVTPTISPETSRPLSSRVPGGHPTPIS
jgi:hypothetical protein